ncbi:MAG: hypothetical protein ACOYXY_02895 [Thermodesulfobacteriota bacterium]
MSRFREWSSRAVNRARELVAGRLPLGLCNKIAGRSLESRRGFRFSLDRGCRVARREFLMSLGALSVAWPELRGHSEYLLLGLSRKRAMFSRKT